MTFDTKKELMDMFEQCLSYLKTDSLIETAIDLIRFRMAGPKIISHTDIEPFIESIAEQLRDAKQRADEQKSKNDKNTLDSDWANLVENLGSSSDKMSAENMAHLVFTYLPENELQNFMAAMHHKGV